MPSKLIFMEIIYKHKCKKPKFCNLFCKKRNRNCAEIGRKRGKFGVLYLTLLISIIKILKKKLIHSRLKDLLRLRLTECGWNDEVRLLCRDVIKEDGGNVNVEKIVKQVTPKARSLVPDTVKRELLQKIKTILSTQGGVDM